MNAVVITNSAGYQSKRKEKNKSVIAKRA